MTTTSQALDVAREILTRHPELEDAYIVVSLGTINFAVTDELLPILASLLNGTPERREYKDRYWDAVDGVFSGVRVHAYGTHHDLEPVAS